MRKWMRGIWIGAVISGLACGAARASIIAGDHFNLSPIDTQSTDLGSGVYSGDAALGGAGPAVTGFNSGTNWTFGSTTGTATTPSTTGLTYSDSSGHILTTSGGMIQYTGPSSGSTSLDRYTRTSNVTTLQTIYYASVLIDVSSFSLSTNQALMELKFANGSTYVQFGLRNSNAVIFNTTGGSLSSTQTPVAATTSSAFTANTTHLLVLKIVGQAGGNDAVSLYIDPTDLTTESGTVLTVTNGLGLLPDAGDKLGLWAIYGGRSLGTSNFADIDEMRVGTSWADVVPVPEPTSAGMLTEVCGSALLTRRRRASAKGRAQAI